jgi:hypothetical protein
MSHEQKTAYNDLLTSHIRRIQSLHPELTSFSATVRYLVTLGLAAEYARDAAATPNPYLYPSKELTDP